MEKLCTYTIPRNETSKQKTGQTLKGLVTLKAEEMQNEDARSNFYKQEIFSYILFTVSSLLCGGFFFGVGGLLLIDIFYNCQ